MTSSKITLAVMLIVATTIDASGIVPSPYLAPGLSYTQAIPYNVAPFAASVSTFSKALTLPPLAPALPAPFALPAPAAPFPAPLAAAPLVAGYPAPLAPAPFPAPLAPAPYPAPLAAAPLAAGYPAPLAPAPFLPAPLPLGARSIHPAGPPPFAARFAQPYFG